MEIQVARVNDVCSVSFFPFFQIMDALSFISAVLKRNKVYETLSSWKWLSVKSRSVLFFLVTFVLTMLYLIAFHKYSLVKKRMLSDVLY